MKRFLILGGTQFIGRQLVAHLLASGQYELMLFNRGRTNPDLFPEVQRITGDRNTDDVRQLANEEWDTILDISCYFPDSLSSVLEAVQGRVGNYLLMSTCSVYENTEKSRPLRDETAPLHGCDDRQRVDQSNATYGNRKAECDRILMASGLDYTIFRPALVVGPYDHTDRFYYWLHQVHQKDRLLVPEGGTSSISYTYVKDLVQAVLRSVSGDFSGQIFNIVSRPELSIREIIEEVSGQLGRTPRLIDASIDFLEQQGIEQWVDMPLWLNSDLFTYANQKMIRQMGLQPTPFTSWLNETLEYYTRLNWPDPHFGMGEERRLQLLDLRKNSPDFTKKST